MIYLALAVGLLAWVVLAQCCINLVSHWLDHLDRKIEPTRRYGNDRQ